MGECWGIAYAAFWGFLAVLVICRHRENMAKLNKAYPELDERTGE